MEAKIRDFHVFCLVYLNFNWSIYSCSSKGEECYNLCCS